MVCEKCNESSKNFTAGINRHLLFNTLNAAVSLCRRKPEEAAELLINLSDFLMYVSEEKPAVVLLDDELKFIRSYLYIQSVRFGKRLNIKYEIDNDITAVIPPYALYVILDNVFEHVMMKTVQEVTVIITVKQDDGKTAVTIQDNGAGIPEERMNNLMVEYHGHSLERLNHLLKQNCLQGLQIESKENQGTIVTIHTARPAVN